jgi:hypothetical protein
LDWFVACTMVPLVLTIASELQPWGSSRSVLSVRPPRHGGRHLGSNPFSSTAQDVGTSAQRDKRRGATPPVSRRNARPGLGPRPHQRHHPAHTRGLQHSHRDLSVVEPPRPCCAELGKEHTGRRLPPLREWTLFGCGHAPPAGTPSSTGQCEATPALRRRAARSTTLLGEPPKTRAFHRVHHPRSRGTPIQHDPHGRRITPVQRSRAEWPRQVRPRLEVTDA